MYFVQCPKCQQRLKVKERLHQAKVRCSKCKEVFLADTREAADGSAAVSTSRPAAPAASRPASPVVKKAASTAQRPPTASHPASPSRPAAPPASDFAPAEEGSVSAAAPIDLGAPPDPNPPLTPTPAAAAPRRAVRKKSIVPMIVVIAAIVLIPIFAYIVYWSATHVKLNGAWVLKSDYDAQVAAANAAKEAAATAPKEEHDPFWNPATRKSSGDPSAPGKAGGADKTVYTNVVYDPAKVVGSGKDKILVQGNIGQPSDSESQSGNIVGEVQNCSRTRTIQKLELSFDIMDANDQPRARTTSIVIEYIPPGANMHYSVKYSVVGKYLRAEAKVDEAPENIVCWLLDGNENKLRLVPDPKGTMFRMTGSVTNNGDDPVKDVAIYASLFTGSETGAGGGEFVDNVQAKLQGGDNSLAKDATGSFTIEYDTTSGKNYVPLSIIYPKNCDVRLVGKK